MSQQNHKLFMRITGNSYRSLSKLIKPSMSLDSGIGSLGMSPGCSDEYVVRRLFVFIKDNLIFESLQDGLMQKKLLSEREKEEYVCSNCARHYWSERLLKLIIRKERCKEFVAFIHQMACHKHVSEKIMEVQEKAKGGTLKAANGAVQRRINLTLTHELLQRHFACLYMELEPREIANEMFQAGHLTVFDHDNVTESNQRYKRLSFLLNILMKKELYAQLVCTLQSLGYRSVLDTLQKDRKLKNKPSEYSTCIQHNFILLQENIPCFGDARFLMEHELDSTNISDIESCKNAVRKISKLLKILLIRGKPACKEFFRVIEVDLKREDLIQKMKYKSAEIKRRGKPNLNQRHRSLRTPCLQEHEEFLNEELEPLDISDLLFEEGAMEISAHDKITETSRRQKQMKYLLETVNGNENDCFHFFLYILQKEGYESILEELKKSAPGAVGAVPHEQSENLRLSLRVAREPDDVVNGDIHMRLSVGGRTGPQVEQVLQDSHSSSTEILEEAILHGVVDIRGVSSGSIVLQLRPVTDQAVQTLLNVRDNNRLVEMIVGMLKKVNIASMMDGTEPLEIKVQVYKANPVGIISKAEDAEPIKKRLKAHRNVLVSELEPRAIAHVLSKSKAFAKSAIDSVLNADSCNDRVENLLSLVEDGDFEVVKEFVTALKDLGYSSIVELIDPPDIHNRAENIRKMITSNYKNILEEMQMKLAKETLSKCVGDVDEIREKILPKNGNRKKRMSSFLQFILQDDHNVIEFEKMLRNNDLEDLLKIDENVQGEHIPTQGIEMTFVEDRIHSSSEGVLFEAVITLSHTVKSDRKIQQKVGKVSEETGGQQGEIGGQQGETGAKQLDIDFEKMHLDESPPRQQRPDMTPTSPDIPLKGNESISSVSSSTSLKSIISDAEEDKNPGKTFTKNVPSLKKKKNVVKTFGHEERFDPQKEADVPLPPVRKSALYDEISKKGADFAGSSALPTYQTVLSQTYKLVAAIDFGTTYSGYAFSWKKDPANFVTLKSSSSDKLSEKEPSVLLMDRSEHLVDFGQEAVLKYKEFCEEKLQQDYFYFSNFKMTLHRNENLSRKTIIQDDKGRECLAVTVFSLSIKYFKERLLRQLDKSKDHCSDEDIRWVLTVPAIWGEQAKQLMQESAEMAGISQHKLMLALEPEVAAVFVKEIQIERQADELSKYRPGKKFLVMDLGGGTADLTAMEVVDDGSLKQLHRACGGDWGGNKVNDNFFKFLGSLFGHSVIKECEERYRSDFLDLQKEIEVMKRKFGKGDYMYNSPPKFQIPYMYQTFIKEHHEMELKAIVANSEFSQDAFLSDNGKLKLSAKLIKTLLFNPVVNCIKQETENVLHELRGQIQDIMMVGGFSESEFVYQTIKESFPRTKLLRANEAGLAVLKGAVLYGHSPGVISSRRCAFTYGVGLYRVFLKGHDPEDLKCKIQGEDNISVFVKMVTVGDEVGIGETFDLDEEIFPVKKDAPQMSFKIYRSALDNPVYIDESSIQIGKLTVKNITSSVRISLCFGLTQITVMAVNTDTKENAIAELDLLGEL